ncbi:MAG: phospholipase D-like domain-containing protein [bacterium]
MLEIASIISSDECLKKLMQLLRSKKCGEIFSGNELSDELNMILNKGAVRPLMYILRSVGVLTVVGTGYSITDYSFKINAQALNGFENELKIWMSLSSKYNMVGRDRSTTIQILATLPPVISLRKEVPRIPSVSSGIARLISSAKDSIWIVNPFFDEVGTAYLIPFLSNACLKGVEIKITTRRPVSNSISDGQRTALRMVWSELGSTGKLFLRSFHGTGNDAEPYGLHSKVLVTDDDSCYLGSANITGFSFRRNFELGVLLRGDAVKDILKIVRVVWNASDAIDEIELR